MVKNLSILGVHWGAYAKLDPKVLTDSFKILIDWYMAGKLKPHVSNILPLAEANVALDLLRTRTATGKVIIDITK
jgi:NADPH2:quinone reductase